MGRHVSFETILDYYEKPVTLIANPIGLSRYHQTDTQLQEEEQLIFEAKADPDKFRPLYNKYFTEIFRFVHRRTESEELAADLSSQVFLKAMQKLQDYEFRGVPFSAWLYRIASNEVNIYFRDLKKKRTVNLDAVNLKSMMDEVEEDDFEIQKQSMLKAFQLLKPQELQMVELRFFEKMPFREIGEILGITENNAKVRMYRILDKMKKLMKA